MAGQYRFKDINGNIVAQISASSAGAISFSGSAVDFSNASTITLGGVQLAGTASNALLLDGFDSTAFVFTSSFNTISQSISSQLTTLQTTSGSNIGRLNNLESKSSSVDISISNINSVTSSVLSRTSNLESKSSSVDISISNINSVTASNIARLSNLETKSSSVDISITNINSVTASNLARLTNLETKSASVDISVSSINTFTASNSNTSLNNLTGSLATTGSNSFYGTQVFSGSVFIANDLIVQGSSSIQYISASSVSIGTNIVQLNTATPSVRYAGLAVQDSGSSAGITGSILWDSLCNRWMYSNPSTIGYSGGIIMSGPRAATLGQETTLTCNYIAKSGGGDHLYDSCIIDDGTTTCIKNNLVGTGTITGTTIFGSTIACSPIGCFATSCATSFIGGTMSGTTIYGSTTICSAVGYFSGCVGIGISPQSILETFGASPIVTITDSNTFSSGVARTSGIEFKAFNPSGNITTQSAGIYGVITPETGYTPNQGYLTFYTRLQGASYTEKMRITSAGIVCFANTVCVPNLYMNGGIINQQSGDLSFWVPNVGQALTITQNTGRVGIGTITPDRKLDIASANASDTKLVIRTACGFAGSYSPSLDFHVGGYESTCTTGQIKMCGTNNYSGDMIFSTQLSGTINPLVERMRISCGGNVGIGINPTSTFFQVSGNSPDNIAWFNNTQSNGYASARFYNNCNKAAVFGVGGSAVSAPYANNGYIYTDSGVDLAFAIGGVERMRITSTGIATFTCTVCSTNFQTGANSNLSKSSIRLRSANDNKYLDFNSFNTCNVINSNYGDSDIPLILGTYFGHQTNQLFLATNCNVGIGTNSPNEKLDVNGTIQVRGSSLGYATTQCVGMLDFYASATRLLSFGGDATTCGCFRFYSAGQNNNGGSDVATISGGGTACFKGAVCAPQFLSGAGTVTNPYGSWTTLFTIPTGQTAVYIAHAVLAGQGGYYTSTVMLGVNSAAISINHISNAGGACIRVDGYNVQVSNGSGFQQQIDYKYFRMG